MNRSERAARFQSDCENYTGLLLGFPVYVTREDRHRCDAVGRRVFSYQFLPSANSNRSELPAWMPTVEDLFSEAMDSCPAHPLSTVFDPTPVRMLVERVVMEALKQGALLTAIAHSLERALEREAMQPQEGTT